MSLGHSEKLMALRMADSRYAAEQNKTLRLFEQTAPTFPRPPGAAIYIQAEIDRLSAMSSPTSATSWRSFFLIGLILRTFDVLCKPIFPILIGHSITKLLGSRLHALILSPSFDATGQYPELP